MDHYVYQAHSSHVHSSRPDYTEKQYLAETTIDHYEIDVPIDQYSLDLPNDVTGQFGGVFGTGLYSNLRSRYSTV